MAGYKSNKFWPRNFIHIFGGSNIGSYYKRWLYVSICYNPGFPSEVQLNVSAKSPPDPPQGKLSADRLLNALSPALSAELERMLEEFRGSLDAEATVRLKKALLDKEAEFRARAEEEERRVREETSEQVRAEVTTELEARFKSDLAAELEALKGRLKQGAQEAKERWKQERLELIAETERWRLLAEFHRRVGDATSQVEILRRFVAAAERLSEGVALYLNKPDGLALWNTQGEAAAFPELISEDTIDPEWYFAPIVVQSRTVAAVCATGVKDRDSLVVIVDALKRAIENFGLRIRFFGAGGAHEPATSDAVGDPTSSPSAQASDEESAKRGADARRLARMLVSEIKLGNEKEVLEGRVHADLYTRLRKHIDRGRETYERQVPSSDPDQDYFHEELVKILADNDPNRLGEGYPGPS